MGYMGCVQAPANAGGDWARYHRANPNAVPQTDAGVVGIGQQILQAQPQQAAAPATPAAAANPQGYMPTAAQVASTQPLPYSAFGQLPYQQAATYNAASYTPTSVDPNSAQQYTDQYTGLLQQQMNPLFAQQQQQLNESLAARGILNSGAAQQLTNDLSGQQAAAFAGAAAPMVSQGFGYQQQDLTANAGYANSAGQFNAGNQQQANAYNATASNDMNQYNANMYLGATGGDQAAYNNYLAGLLGTGNQYGSNLQNAYINSYAPANPQALSTLGQAPQLGYNAGQNAYNQTANAWGTASNAFSGALSGVLNRGTNANPYTEYGSGNTLNGLDPQYTP